MSRADDRAREDCYRALANIERDLHVLRVLALYQLGRMGSHTNSLRRIERGVEAILAGSGGGGGDAGLQAKINELTARLQSQNAETKAAIAAAQPKP